MEKVLYFQWIDVIKGVAILLVVIGHSIAALFEDSVYMIVERPKTEFFWFCFIYSFHMPLFFWISGYLFPRLSSTVSEESRLFLWRKTYTLIIPFLISGMLLEYVRGRGILITGF